MKASAAGTYRCPATHQPLTLEVVEADGAEVVTGSLLSPTGRSYLIEEGLPMFLVPSRPTGDRETAELAFYESTNATYDEAIDYLFASFHEQEGLVRDGMIELLELSRTSRVLEIGCGTCRDSVRIAPRVAEGEIYLQDRSPSMLKLGRSRMAAAGPFDCAVEYFVGDGAALPFPDRSLDAVFHFGGLNLFTDPGATLQEMARVVRRGGRVVVGDESLAPWLRETLYGRILLASYPLYADPVPVGVLPEGARDVQLRWILGNAYYVLAFSVEEGPPPMDLDLPIPGRRGGTRRTRYYGMLESVTPETRRAVAAAAAESGTSEHEWLEKVLRSALGRSG